jgi:hypothetical protein
VTLIIVAAEQRSHRYVPLDGEASHTGLLGQNVALDALNDGLCRGLGSQLLRVVFVVDIVSYSYEFTAIVGACQEDDCDAEYFGIGNARDVGSIGLEDELVYADGDRPDEQRVKLLVVLVTVGLSVRRRRCVAGFGYTHDVAEPT